MEKALHALANVRTEIESLNSVLTDTEQQRTQALEASAAIQGRLDTARADLDKANADYSAIVGNQKKTIAAQAQQILDLQMRLDALLAGSSEAKTPAPA